MEKENNTENKPCIACGGAMNLTEKQLAERYKEQYEKQGISRWVFTRGKDKPIEFAKDESFKVIKKKLGKNAEFFHISEFRPN